MYFELLIRIVIFEFQIKQLDPILIQIFIKILV